MFEQRMLRKLRQAQSTALECAFSGGSCDQTLTKPDICDPDGDPIEINHCALNSPSANILPLTDPLPTCDALSALVDQLCGCPTGIGMIHAPSFLVSKWHKCDLLESIEVDYDADGWFPGDKGGRRRILIEKTSGHVVVPGCGYSGIGPDGTGQADDETLVWAYATSMVMLLKGQPQVYSAIQREVNLECVVAERSVAAAFDPCCHTAVPVNLCLTDGC